MTIIIVAGGILLIFWAAALYFLSPRNLAMPQGAVTNAGGREVSKPKVKVGNAEFNVDIADTAALREQGLSGRASLAEDAGMFFIFPISYSYGFWMKNMNFPIDIVWIKNDVVAGFSENLQPQPGASMLSLKTYYPPAWIDKVLEINAGLVKKLGLKVGDKVLELN